MFLLMQQFRPETLKEYAHEIDATLSRHQRTTHHHMTKMAAIQGGALTDERKRRETWHVGGTSRLQTVIPVESKSFPCAPYAALAYHG
jgi:hypothetical protein